MSWAISGATETSGFTRSVLRGVVFATPGRGCQRRARGVSDNNTKNRDRPHPRRRDEGRKPGARGGGPWRIGQRIGAPVSNDSAQSLRRGSGGGRGAGAGLLLPLAVAGDLLRGGLAEPEHVDEQHDRDSGAEQQVGQPVAAGAVLDDDRGDDAGNADADDGQAPAGAEHPVDLLERG